MRLAIVATKSIELDAQGAIRRRGILRKCRRRPDYRQRD